jgi:hypothetical protein
MPVMKLLWIILRALFPNDPVQQCIEAARQRIALMVSKVFSPESLFRLAQDPRARLHIEALVIDYESALHFAIGARACQIAKMRFRQQPRTFFRPTRALSVERLLARIRALATMVNSIERLAQARAARLIRERDADPLSLAAHSSPNAWNGAWLRHAAHHEAVGVAQCLVGLMVSSTRSVRLSNHEAVLTARDTSPRGPPPPLVSPHPQPASQAHLRGRGLMRHSRLRRACRLLHPARSGSRWEFAGETAQFPTTPRYFGQSRLYPHACGDWIALWSRVLETRTMATPYKKSPPRTPAVSLAIITAPGNTRSFDMRPKPTDDPYGRRELSATRAAAREQLSPLDPDPGE